MTVDGVPDMHLLSSFEVNPFKAESKRLIIEPSMNAEETKYAYIAHALTNK